MIMYNKDGSEGNMCGNGIRCVAKYIYDKYKKIKNIYRNKIRYKRNNN